MKKYWFCILVLLFACNAVGQKIRFSDSTNRWHVTEIYTTGPWSTDYWYGSQYFFRGHYQRRLIIDGLPSQYYVWEDTIQGRVYITDIMSTDTMERLLYRYDLEISDTVTVAGYIDSLISKDSIIIDGLYHTTFTLNDLNISDFTHHYDYIEGIGSLEGPLYPFYAYCTPEFYGFLTCFQNKGVFPSISYSFQDCFESVAFVNAATCADSFMSITSTITPLNAFVAPNPINYNSRISLSKKITRGKLSVYNNLGLLIVEFPLQSTQQIPINFTLKAGLYYFCISDEKGSKAVGKLLFQ